MTGASGIDGDAGATGGTGGTGGTGIQGDVGGTGGTGSSGSTGITGLTGASGIDGDAGATGSTGDQGPTGSVGPTGASGGTGSTGSLGSTGATGVSVQILSFPFLPVETTSGGAGPEYPWLGELIPVASNVSAVQISGDITGTFQYRITTGSQANHPNSTKVTPVVDPTWTVNASNSQESNANVTPSQLATNNSLDNNTGTWDNITIGAGPQLYQYNWQASARGTTRFNQCRITFSTPGTSAGGPITFSYIPKGQTGTPGNYVVFDIYNVAPGALTNQTYTANVGTTYDWEWVDGILIDVQLVGAGTAQMEEFDTWYFTEANAVNATLDTTLTGWNKSLTANNVLSATVISVNDRVDNIILSVEITAT